MYGYVYLTTNLINNKQYIGQHHVNNNRFDKNYFGSGKLLLEAIKKYGKENFKCEIIEWCESDIILSERETFWIDYYDASNNLDFYNISSRGGFPFGIKIREKQSLAAKGKPKSLNARRKMSLSKQGKYIGKNNPAYNSHFKWYTDGNKNIRLKSDQLIPKNFYPGFTEVFTKIWITDGINNKRIDKNSDIPIGYHIGRIINWKCR